MRFGAEDYRRGAFERIDDARSLLESGHWVGAAYLAGRASECALRAFLRASTPVNESGHDLRDLMKRAAGAGLLRRRDEDAIYEPVCEIAALWHNNLRFADQQRFLRHLRQLKRDRNLRGDPVEFWARRLVDHGEAVFSRAEVIWHRSKKS